MDNLIVVDFNRAGETNPTGTTGVITPISRGINVSALKSNRSLGAGLINVAQEEYEDPALKERATEPIKSLDDINRITEYLISKERYRDNMLFIVGINFGLRYSDLIELRFGNLITPEFVFKETFPIYEKKTRNTRKKKMNRYVTINDAVVDAVTLYLEHTPEVSLSDYLFTSVSTNGLDKGRPLTHKSVDRILKGIVSDLGIAIRISTHTLRKTFCYHQMVMSNNDGRKLLLLQKMLNHSSPAQTLDYIGITSEEIEEAYMKLNLGGVGNYLVNSKIIERTEVSSIG